MTRLFPAVPGVEHRFVDADGLRVHVAESGQGDPIVLLHGWPQHWYAWRGLIPALAESRRVICPDLRGHGWSEAPPTGYEKEQLASDLIATLDALELERVTLVGHDWGGFASFLAALRAPERFERLVVMSIITPWFRARITPRRLATVSYQFVIMTPLIGRLIVQHGPLVRTMFRAGTGPGNELSEEAVASYVDAFRERERAVATVGVYRSFQLRELRPIAAGRYADKRLTVPTLFIHGEHDPVINDDSLGAWREHADAMEVEALPGVGHFAPEEAPKAVLKRLGDFLERG